MPTGSGKTRAFVELARRMGGRVLVVAHRHEILRQTEDTFCEVYPQATVAVIHGKKKNGPYPEATAYLATVQTLSRRLDTFPANYFDLVVIDEAHHVTADSWRKVVRHFTPALLLGCTATPERLDGKKPTGCLGEPVHVYGLTDAIDTGILVPLRHRAVFTPVSLDGIGSPDADFDESDLSAVVNVDLRNEIVLESYRRYAAGRPTLIFAASVKHVKALQKRFKYAGIPTATIIGTTEDDARRQALHDFAIGAIGVIIGCEVLTEGYDEKSVSCVIMARPTKSLALYQQCVGRGLRRHPGGKKKDCLVIDIRDETCKHRLATASMLVDHSSAGSISSRVEVIDCEGRDVREAVECELQRLKLNPLAPTPGQKVRWAMGEDVRWPELPTLDGYVSSKAWLDKPASVNQLRKLKGFGMEARRSLTWGEADYLIKRCRELAREYPTPATEKQRRTLLLLGIDPTGVSKRKAKGIIYSRLSPHLRRGA
jgi:superfamily II DNA or RNA helicase